jgi:hypothetical protein
MRSTGIAALALTSVVTASLPAAAQTDVKGMDKVDCPKAVANIAACYSAKLDTGAYVTAAMPKTWNGDLIVFAHGGPNVAPPAAKDGLGNLNRYAFGVKQGYAWIASSYRKEGYGVQMAAADTDDARQFFLAHFSMPKRTILHGASYGGLVGAKLLETYVKKNPDGGMTYDGAFFNSGAVGGAMANYEFRSDLRAVYQHFCMNLPKPDEAQYPPWMGLPPDSKMSLREVNTRIDECTGVAKPAEMRSDRQKQNLANILNVRDRSAEDVMVPRADIVAVDGQEGCDVLLVSIRRGQQGGGVQRTGGYCWPTPKYRNWCVQYAFFEGKKAEETSPRKSTPRTLK